MQPVKISKSSVPSKVRHGHKVVGTSAVQLVPVSGRLTTGLLLRAPGGDDPVSNTAPIWIGNANVTADSDVTTGGFPIPPGGSLTINVDAVTELYLVSTAVSQDIAWIAI